MKTDVDALFLGEPHSIGQVDVNPDLRHFDSIKFKTFGTFYIGVITNNHDFGSNIGYDEDSWALAYDGRIFHNSESFDYCEPLKDPSFVVIRLLKSSGELKFIVNGVDNGVAFKHPIFRTGNLKVKATLRYESGIAFN